MSGIIERFGSTSVILDDPEDDLGDPEAYNSQANYPPGGALDDFGGQQTNIGMRQIRKHGEITASSVAALMTAADALRAMKGKRQVIYIRMGDGTVRWMTARCINVEMPRDIKHALFLPVDLSWIGFNDYWRGAHHGAGWTWDSGAAFDSGSAWDEDLGDTFALAAGATTVCAVVNNGNAPNSTPKLTITAGSAAITNIVITATVDTGAVSLSFAPDVALSKSLVIDGARLSVRNDGLDAYSSLVRHGTDHTIVELLRLPPGTTNYSITLVGGGTGSKAVWDYDDHWQ